jgi:flavin-dependent dehydrogenase
MTAGAVGRVAVVGAGPAGCSAAVALAAAGVSVTVFEQGGRGKDKACGDALLPEAVSLLRDLGLNVQDTCGAGGRRFSQIELWGHETRIWRVPVGPDPGWIAPRATLDQALRDVIEPRVEVRYVTAVRDIELSTRGAWLLTFECGAATPDTHQECFGGVILATGATARLSRRWSIDGRPIMGASVSAYADGADLECPRFHFPQDELPGYAWAFPLAGGRANLGYCTLTASRRPLRSAAQRYLARLPLTARGPLRGGTGPLWSGRGRRWHDGRGLASCGDAAGLVDPTTGEGITAALQSGGEAGRALGEFLASGKDRTPLERYSAWVRAGFGVRYGMNGPRRVWSTLCRTGPGTAPSRSLAAVNQS